MARPKIIITPEKSAILAGHKNKLHVLVRIQAPELPEGQAKQRQPYGISFVIDRSGSMRGEPLMEAVRCAGFMADRLRDDDMAALVTFDNRISLEAPLSKLSDRTRLRAALATIHPGGNTDLHGGWREGAVELQRKEPVVSLKRVVLLSDGCANNGITDPAEIARQASELAASGITTSTYGLGRHFNEELMVELTKAGQGNHYYAETADDLLESFNEEFELMANLWSKGLTLMIAPVEEVTFKLLNDYPVVGEHGQSWRLPNIAYGAEAWAMLEVTVPEYMANWETVAVLAAHVTGVDINGNEIQEESFLQLPSLNAAAFEAIAQDELVSRRLDEVQAAQCLTRARDAVRRGDWNTADGILEEARARFRSSPWAQEVLSSMEKLAAKRDDAMFMKEALFSRRKMSSRQSSSEESLDLSNDADEPAYLRRKSAQGKAQYVKRDQDKDIV